MKTITYFSRDKGGCPSGVVVMTLISLALSFLWILGCALFLLAKLLEGGKKGETEREREEQNPIKHDDETEEEQSKS